MIIAFKHGKLANCFRDIEEASRGTIIPIEKIQRLIINGDMHYSGYSFDYGLDGLSYEGWGCEDERNLVV